MNEFEIKKIKNAIAFTEVYKKYSYDKCLREAKCVEYQLDKILCPINEKDRIAGRIEHGYIGFSSQYGGVYTYFYNEHDYLTAMDKCKNQLDEETLKQAEFLAEFWKLENTEKKLNSAFIHKYGFELPHSYKNYGIVNCSARVAGNNLDFHKLIQLGFDGLDKEIDNAVNEKGDSSFYKALKLWIEILRQVCEKYRLQAVDMATRGSCNKTIVFEKMAEGLANIKHNPPATFWEGLQLMWIYSICCDLMNYGRMDDYLGKLYSADLEAGIITEEEALEDILGLYKHFKEVGKVHDCRVIIGGRGRKNSDEADQLAMIIMEASRQFKDTVPQLTLRYFKGMSKKVFRKAMEVNAEGCTFPIIYSDETNIPAVEKIYGVTRVEAEQYVPFGCGEYVLVGMSTGTPNNGVNMLKALEVTLHNGMDAYHNVFCGEQTGKLEQFETFEQLYQAMLTQLKKPVEYLADHKRMNYTIAGQEAPYLHLSLLMNDCVEKGLPLLEGGVRYLNAASEVFGIISCADSLTAIKKLVFEDKKFTLRQLVAILDADYEGFVEERKLLLNTPKYGNDNEEADTMAVKVFNDIADMTIKAGEKAGIHKYAIVSVNNSMSAEWGSYCVASACGRRKSAAMSNANAPSLGADKNGITALLNSMSKFDATKHVGVINNIRFTKELFVNSMDKIEMLLKTFYENGGVQNNITVIGKEDLENALKEPEKYQNLIVRIGGFSARFVALSPVIQREIIERTTYDV